jgi:hypothetical protein
MKFGTSASAKTVSFPELVNTMSPPSALFAPASM